MGSMLPYIAIYCSTMDPMGNSIGFVNTARLGCAYAKTTPLLLAGRSQMSPAEDWRGSAGSKM